MNHLSLRDLVSMAENSQRLRDAANQEFKRKYRTIKFKTGSAFDNELLDWLESEAVFEHFGHNGASNNNELHATLRILATYCTNLKGVSGSEQRISVQRASIDNVAVIFCEIGRVRSD